jgi:hypothetical protein
MFLTKSVVRPSPVSMVNCVDGGIASGMGGMTGLVCRGSSAIVGTTISFSVAPSTSNKPDLCMLSIVAGMERVRRGIDNCLPLRADDMVQDQSGYGEMSMKVLVSGETKAVSALQVVCVFTLLEATLAALPAPELNSHKSLGFRYNIRNQRDG